ncbi:MAG TPA: alpha/beta fold hydrolase, partial [Rhizobiaceae bacterium]|nr:alpha/beta fold hydrolase [Rhizobiaceae bacterium]
MTTGFVNGPAGPLHVVSGGDRTAPAILFLHGFPEYHVAWLAVARLLANSFHVILPDMRGFGRSAKPGDVTLYRAGATLADTKAIADAFSPDRPLVVAGHDWGASAAYDFAFAFPSQVE